MTEENANTKVIDYDYDVDALCPFMRKACRMECMLMRPTGFGEPRCSMRVIADELVYRNSMERERDRRDAVK